MSVPSGPKGTRDFYPEEMAVQEFLFNSWKNTCRRYGFESYDAPMFEHLGVYTQKSGAEIEKQLYVFEDKGKRMMALRPEMTPSLARMVAIKGNALKRPIRWYSIARLFRYEKMQKGRLREFYQLNMDILGSSEITADAELIAAVIDMMRDLGLTNNDFRVRISSRTLLDECFSAIGLEQEHFPPLYALLDRKAKISEKCYLNDLAEIVSEASIRECITTLFSAQSIDQIIAIAGKTPSQELLGELFALLDSYGMSEYICFDIGIVRGLAYYTGIVFEVFACDKDMRAIAGGGRYDKLVALYGGPETPAVGFAAGDVVLGNLLAEKGLLPPKPSRSEVYFVAFDQNGYSAIIPEIQKLRNEGIRCEYPFKRINIGKQLKLADAAGAILTVFSGGEEAQKGLYKIKRMLDGSEFTVPKEQLLEKVQSLIQGC